MSKQGLVKLWRKRLEECAQSGHTIADWCRYNHVSVHQYYYWRRRLADHNALPTAQPDPTPTFLPVEVVETLPLPAPAATGLTLRIAGAAIDITPGFDPATLRAVVVALGAISC